MSMKWVCYGLLNHDTGIKFHAFYKANVGGTSWMQFDDFEQNWYCVKLDFPKKFYFLSTFLWFHSATRAWRPVQRATNGESKTYVWIEVNLNNSYFIQISDDSDIQFDLDTIWKRLRKKTQTTIWYFIWFIFFKIQNLSPRGFPNKIVCEIRQ